MKRSVICLASGVALAVWSHAVPAATSLLVQFDPKGRQLSDVPVLPSSQARSVTASALTETGLIQGWFNDGALPVGLVTSAPTIRLGEYLSFTVAAAPGFGLRFDDLLYDKVSYFDNGATRASVRTSLNGFAADAVALTLNPAGVQSLDFALGALPVATGNVEFRLYFYAAPTDRADWDDLLSTDRPGYNGLRLMGEVVPVPEPPVAVLLLLGLAVVAADKLVRAG